MVSREQYEAKKAAQYSRQQREREAAEHRAHEAALAKTWFWKHPDKLVRYTGWLQAYTLFLAIGTVLLFVATVINAIVLKHTDDKIGEQVVALKRQLDLMEADQRPWITFAVAPGSALTFDGNGMRFTLQTAFKNIGRSPARNVYAIAKVYVWTDPEEPLKRLPITCEEVRTRKPILGTQGFLTLPGDVKTPSISLGMNIVDVESWKKIFVTDKVPLVIVGCLDYVIASTGQHRQVGFIYELDQIIGSNPYAHIDPSGGDVPKERLSIQENPNLPWTIN